MFKLQDGILMIELLSLFESVGYSTYIVGGTVRDMIMGRESHDIDIAVSSTPQETIEVAELNHLEWIPTGIDHGTITILYNNQEVQVTTFRKDVECDGRHAVVEYTTSLSEDLSRRDFSINALSMDIHGAIIDNHNGIHDIEHKIIRAVGEPQKRFDEDKLRILRAIRFATVLGFCIEETTWNAILKSNLDGISRERIRDEFTKILIDKNRVKGIRLLHKSYILHNILPEVTMMQNISAGSPRYHPERNTFEHTLIALSKLKERSSLKLCLATLLHDVGKPSSLDKYHYHGHDETGEKVTKEILTRFKFSKDVIDDVCWLVANHMRIHKFNEMRKAKQIRLIQHPLFDDLFELLKADLMVYDEVVNDIITFKKEYKPPSIPSKLINGYDILVLGIPAGKQIGSILTEIENQILEGNITNRDEALNLAECIVKGVYNGNLCNN